MIGQTISHYKILEELGAGGMGVVYKAEDTKLKRTVALKFLPPELTRDKDAKTRFIHEAQAASALQHNNICTIHEIDETRDGRLFISMDCYEGETLKEKIARGPLPLDEALDIAIQVAEGLSKAHEAGMVHRDIKPANIMITSDGVVKIVDFGLAKLAGQTKVTKTGTTVGTVAYMSPEQAMGKNIDHRSDVFSLGSVFYEMLTGELPFKGDHEAAVLYGITNSEPDKLSTYRRDLPEQIQQIIDKALAKDANERHQSASDLLKELTPWRSMRAAVAGSSVSRSRIRLKHIIVVTVLVVVAGAIAFMVGKQRLSAPSAQDFSLAIVDFHDLMTPDDPTISAEITGLLHVGIVESSPIRVVSPDYLLDLRRRFFGSARGPVEEDQILEIARASGAAIVVSGQVKARDYAIWRLVDTQSGRSIAAGRVDGAEATALADQIIAEVLPLLARESGRKTPSSTSPVTAFTTDSPEAYRRFVTGLLAGEKGDMRGAVREFEHAVDLDSTFALAFFELSLHLGEGSERARAAERAWNLRDRLGIKDRMRLEVWWEQLALRFASALAVCQEMSKRWPDDRQVLRELPGLLGFFWRFSEAASVATQALARYPDDIDFALVWGGSLLMAGRAEAVLEGARTYVERHPRNALFRATLARTYLALGYPDSAEAAFEEALEIAPGLELAHRGIIHSAYCGGDLDRAIEIAEELLRQPGRSADERFFILTRGELFGRGLAYLHAEAGRFTNALEVFEKARRYASSRDAEILLDARRIELLCDTGRAEDVLSWARELQTESTSRARWNSALGQAEALVALDLLEAAKAAVASLYETEELGGGYARMKALKLSAKIALAEDEPKRAVELLNEFEGQAVGTKDGIRYHETLARAYQMDGRLEEAARVLKDLLRVNGGHAVSHYELGKIYQEMNRPMEAEQEFSEFLEMWSDADEGLPQLEDARARLSVLHTGS
jgi:tetratricopeptide (TPR) repeat protein/tRNA A-37 threonylcarbamoyl transferase component Bud32